MKHLKLALIQGFIIMIAMPLFLHGQDDLALPYHTIPETPGSFTEHTVAARMVDGLGFRYYWATEGLRENDLAYAPGPESRSSLETLDHIHGLCSVLLNGLIGKPNTRSDRETRSFETLRQETLSMIKAASDELKIKDPPAMDTYKILFQRGESVNEFPFWNMLNGPLADALWHVGQVVSMRRASGNPINPKVSVFSGRVRE